MELKLQALEKDFWITFNNQPNLSERVRQLEDFTEIHRSLIGDLDLYQVKQDSQREIKVDCFKKEIKTLKIGQLKIELSQMKLQTYVEQTIKTLTEQKEKRDYHDKRGN